MPFNRNPTDCKTIKNRTKLDKDEEVLLGYLRDGLKDNRVLSNAFEMNVAEVNKQEFSSVVSINCFFYLCV